MSDITALTEWPVIYIVILIAWVVAGLKIDDVRFLGFAIGVSVASLIIAAISG